MDVERRAARKRGDCKIFSLKWKMRVYVQAKEATASSFLPTVRLSFDFTVHFTIYIFIYLIGIEAQIGFDSCVKRRVLFSPVVRVRLGCGFHPPLEKALADSRMKQSTQVFQGSYSRMLDKMFFF